MNDETRTVYPLDLVEFTLR